MKILVTGGMGFIGSHLVDALVKDGHSVTVFDNLEEQVHQGKKPEYLNPDAKYIIGDVSDREAFKTALCDCDIVFHEAATVGVGQSMYKIAHYIYSNDLGTANLLDIIVNEKNKIKKIIVASSMSIYGEGAYKCSGCGEIMPHLRNNEQLKAKDWQMHCPYCLKVASPLPTPENKTSNPTSVYAFSKKHQEELCLLIGNTYKIPTVALRYFNVYGPRQALSNPYTGVCAIFSARVKNNNSPLIYEDGLQIRDFIHVSDIVKANLLVMNKKEADYRALNVGTGKPTSILEVAEILIKLHNKSVEPKVVNKFRAGDIRHCFADIGAIRSLGFNPSVDFTVGLRNLVTWSNGVDAEDSVEAANRELDNKGLITAFD